MATFTEEQAKRKLCPFATNPNFLRQGIDCLASVCMAWRWSDGFYEFVTMDNRCVDEEMSAKKGIRWLSHTNSPPPAPAGEGWEPMGEPKQADGFVEGVLQQKWRRPKNFRLGYCGLAGKAP